MESLPDRLLAMLAASEPTDAAERADRDPAIRCTFVDMRPAEFASLIREAAQSLQAPEGWVLVPREPTEAMVSAAMDCQEADPADDPRIKSGAFCVARYPMRMLPDGFTWIPRGQYAEDELALTVNGRHVAILMNKVDGVTWMARLDCHQPITAPVVTRDCASFDSGKAGIEDWSRKHEARLRREVGDYPHML